MRSVAAEEQALAQQNPRQQQQQQQQQMYHYQRMAQVEEDEFDHDMADAETLCDMEGSAFDDDDVDELSTSPSIIDEDIDFEFVYALHTFTATVEGQATASKGEHMQLLDDNNSYWWLVRVVRTQQLGYLPAEHIETPLERLARLNKHRNIDLATAMLCDTNSEKSKNPIKKAMRKRAMKSVAFAPPTYIEPSEYEYTTDEEEDDDGDFFVGGEDDEEVQSEQADARKEPVAEKTNGTTQAQTDEPLKSTLSATQNQNTVEVRPSQEISRTSEDGVRPRPNPTPAALRHPDSSIFNDESRATMKLTLTPNLLRDDPAPTDMAKGRTSIEKQIRREDLVTSPQLKEGKKLKKGSSVLGSLFKRKNKGKHYEDDTEEWLHRSTSNEKHSLDSSHSSETAARDRQGSQSSRDAAAEEIQQREERRRQQEKQIQEQQKQQQEQQQRDQELRARQQQAQRQQTQQQANTSIRRVEEKPTQQPTDSSPSQPTPQSPVEARQSQEEAQRPYQRPIESGEQSPRSPITDRYRPRKMSGDRSQGLYTPYSPLQSQPQQNSCPTLRSPISLERLSESPEHISYHDATEQPDLVLDTSSGIDSNGAISSVESSPDIMEPPAPTHTINRTWSDWSLKTYMEDDTDVRDMLIVVRQDKTPVIAGEDTVLVQGHPEITPLFADSSLRLQELSNRLDGMLGEWMARRTKAH
ncbi:hypothetical protein EX30DRAFT_372136 [Ascodesmis nigricans]|uniref:SH3 domain-containing protein n=1 Tax=Ascodesmis nigricans TaxID=341454 RepID=A0A4V3SIK3_9PEZI|nr:hypothetical protein EX30DRAFT_372136 [Ascodesmis nigricans]